MFSTGGTASPWTCGRTECATAHTGAAALALFCSMCGDSHVECTAASAPTHVANIVKRSAYFSAQLAALEQSMLGLESSTELHSFASVDFIKNLKKKPRPPAFASLVKPLMQAHADAKNLVRALRAGPAGGVLHSPLEWSAAAWRPALGAAVRLRDDLTCDTSPGFPAMVLLRDAYDPTALGEAQQRMDKVDHVLGVYMRHATRTFGGCPVYQFAGQLGSRSAERGRMSVYLYFDDVGKNGRGKFRWKVGREDPSKHDALVQCHHPIIAEGRGGAANAAARDAARLAALGAGEISPVGLRWQSQKRVGVSAARSSAFPFPSRPVRRRLSRAVTRMTTAVWTSSSSCTATRHSPRRPRASPRRRRGAKCRDALSYAKCRFTR